MRRPLLAKMRPMLAAGCASMPPCNLAFTGAIPDIRDVSLYMTKKVNDIKHGEMSLTWKVIIRSIGRCASCLLLFSCGRRHCRRSCALAQRNEGHPRCTSSPCERILAWLRAREPEMPGSLVCVRLSCLTSCFISDALALSGKLRIAHRNAAAAMQPPTIGGQLRLQCKRPHDVGAAFWSSKLV